MAKEVIQNPSWRVRRAYRTAFRVMGSYIWASLQKKIRGEGWYLRQLPALHRRNAERVKNAVVELQGLFIKMGQMLSILSNFLPEEFQQPLESLQDKIPARPYPEVRQRIVAELGARPEEIFERFDQTPIAAASIGQAHRAKLKDGTEVVVKAQHLEIEAVARIDLDIIRRLTRIVSWFFGIRGMDFMYSQIRKMIEEELDFRQEAAAIKTIGHNLRGEQKVAVPKVHDQFSTARVLTTTFHEGVKIGDLQTLESWKIDRSELASRLLKVYCRMVFKDAFYHADPHPGNLLVQPDGTLVLLDFGATASLSPALREGIPALIEAALKNDTDATIEACQQMGFLAEGRDAEKMARRMVAALRNFLQNEVQFEGLNFRDIKINPLNNSLFDLVRDIGFRGISGTVQVPKDYVLFNRTVALLLGICNTLDPKLNPLNVVRPYAQEYLLDGKGGVIGYARNLIQRTLTNALTLPDELQKTLQKARRGDLELATPDASDAAKLLYFGIQQLIFAVFALASGWLWLHFFEKGETRLARFSGGATLLFSAIVFLKMLAGSRVRRRLR